VAVDLDKLVAPGICALVVSELQRDVVGDLSKLPELRAAAGGAVANSARLVSAAHRARVQVVHCTAVTRADRVGANTNTRLSVALARRHASTALPADPNEAASVVPEIDVTSEDVVLSRLAGMSPMTDTGLDSLLRNLGVTTVVVAGVSLNVAIPNAVMDAVNRGYRVVVAKDAVAGTPSGYADEMLRHTIGYLAFITTTAELAEAWESAAKRP